jgi:mono/diheme cytochrome c family protein
MLACALAVIAWSLGLPNAAAQQHEPGAHVHAGSTQLHESGPHVRADATQQHEPGAHVHADAAKLVNPVKPTPASVAAGKKLYEAQCVSCHGATGLGDGKMAAKMTPKPSNLTDTTWKHGSSDGEIYTLIKDGTKDTPMKGFASKMTANDMWSLVNYIRTLNTSK